LLAHFGSVCDFVINSLHWFSKSEQDSSFLEVKKSRKTFSLLGYCLFDSGAFSAYMNSANGFSWSSNVLGDIWLIY
jgi:hypothetical protein